MSIYGLNDNDRRKVAASLQRDRHAARRANGVMTPHELFEQFPREIEWKNYGGSTCPPGGVIKIIDYEADSTDTSWRLHGERPDDTRGNFYAINGSTGVANGEIGQCILFGHALAKLPDTVVQGDTVYAKEDSWDAADSGDFAIGKVLGSSVTLQVNDSGSSAGLKPILLSVETANPIKHGQAKANWKKQTPGIGNWPSALLTQLNPREFGYVEVDRVIGEDSATEFRVYIPTVIRDGVAGVGSGDPNVVEDQYVTFVEVPGQTDPLDSGLPYYEVVGEGYVDRAIGTVEMQFADSAPRVPTGWAVCDGTQDTDKTATGAAIDMTGRFPWGNGSYMDTFAGGITIPAADVAAAIDDHALTLQAVDNNLDDSTVNVIDTVAGSTTNAVHVASVTDITITEANSRPKSIGVFFLERIDNAAN